MGYQKGLANMANAFFEKKTGLESKASVNEELAQPRTNKPVI